MTQQHWKGTGTGLSAVAIIMCLASCASTPYERAIRESAAREREESRLAQLHSRDMHRIADRKVREDAVLRADILDAVHELIREANLIAEGVDGGVYLQSGERDRMIAFAPPPWDSVTGRRREDSSDVPDGAVLEQWTDRFAMAQEVRYRYSNPRVLRTEESTKAPYFHADVQVTLITGRRGSQTNELHPIPQAPEGLEIWRDPNQRFGHRAGSGQETNVGPFLPQPLVSGELVRGTAPSTPLELSAVEALGSQEWMESTRTMTLRLDYDLEFRAWKLVQSSGTMMKPLAMTRPMHGSHTNNDFIFTPGKYGTPKSK